MVTSKSVFILKYQMYTWCQVMLSAIRICQFVSRLVDNSAIYGYTWWWEGNIHHVKHDLEWPLSFCWQRLIMLASFQTWFETCNKSQSIAVSDSESYLSFHYPNPNFLFHFPSQGDCMEHKEHGVFNTT